MGLLSFIFFTTLHWIQLGKIGPFNLNYKTEASSWQSMTEIYHAQVLPAESAI